MANSSRTYHGMDEMYKNLINYELAQPNRVMELITGLGIGGAERVVIELSNRLPETGWEPIVVALDDNGPILRQYQDLPFNIRFLGIKKYNPYKMLVALYSLVQLVRRSDIKVIHAHMFHALIAGLICRIAVPKVRLVFTSHNTAGFGFVRKLIIQITKSLRAADIVFSKNQHVSLNVCNTHIIPNGVLTDEYLLRVDRKNVTRRIFLFVGRLELQKNLLALIDAVARMKNINSELWIAGTGSLLPTLKERIAYLDLSNRVRLLGHKDNVAELFSQVDYFVMSSLWEGLPMALLEAGSYGLPVVATPVGAIPNLLSNECGYITKVDDLSDTLDYVIDNYSEAVQRGHNIKQRIETDYSIDSIVRKHSDLYSSLFDS